mgnify:CR=1 FL=1
MKSIDFNLSDFLPYQLAVLTSRVSKVLSTTYEDRFGLSIPEWRVLVHVSQCEKVSIREIHNCVNLEKPRVSRAVSKLVSNGLLDKTTNPHDQRLVEIKLTDEGLQVLQKIIPDALSFEANLLGSFSESDVTQLFELMERLHAELDNHANAPKRSRLDTN